MTEEITKYIIHLYESIKYKIFFNIFYNKFIYLLISIFFIFYV